MAQGFIHTVYKNEQWVNEVEEGAEFGGAHATKEDVVAPGRERARQDKTSTSSTTRTARLASATHTVTIPRAGLAKAALSQELA